MIERSEPRDQDLPQPWHALATWLVIASGIVVAVSAGYLFATASGRIDALLPPRVGERILLLSALALASVVFAREVLRSLPRTRKSAASAGGIPTALRVVLGGVALFAFSISAGSVAAHVFEGRSEAWGIFARDATKHALLGCATAVPFGLFMESTPIRALRYSLLIWCSIVPFAFLMDSNLPFLGGRNGGARWILFLVLVLGVFGIAFVVRKRKPSHA